MLSSSEWGKVFGDRDESLEVRVCSLTVPKTVFFSTIDLEVVVLTRWVFRWDRGTHLTISLVPAPVVGRSYNSRLPSTSSITLLIPASRADCRNELFPELLETRAIDSLTTSLEFKAPFSVRCKCILAIPSVTSNNNL